MPTGLYAPRPALARLALVLALFLGASGCDPAPTRVPTVPASAPLTGAPPTPAPSPTAAAAASATPPGPGASPSPSQAASALSGYAWDDRSPFAAGLTAAEAPVLKTLPGASVYHIAITIDPSLTRVQGHEAVRYTNQEDAALEEVVFRLYPNLLGGQVSVSALTADGAAVTPAYDQSKTALRVPLDPALEPGGSVVIELDFDVRVPEELERNYGVLAAAEDVLALAHFYPFIAVYDDEGWNDEIAPVQGDVIYGDASFFIVEVRAPDNLVLAGSGSVIAEHSAPGEQALTYALGPARDFYLAASEHYVLTSQQAGATTVRVYAPEAFSAAAQQTVADAIAAMEVYAARYGPYPYSELDLVATPTYALGIEYPGIIALTNKLLDPRVNVGSDPVRESVTAHEVGHQWFYNLIGNDQLDDPWLDESLTQYATWQYFADTHGPEAAAGFRASLESRWSGVDFAEIPIGLPVAAYEDEAYSAIVYGRGPLFFEALAEKMGRAAFDAFLADYALTYRWGIATPEGLRAVAEATCTCELGALFEKWVLE